MATSRYINKLSLVSYLHGCFALVPSLSPCCNIIYFLYYCLFSFYYLLFVLVDAGNESSALESKASKEMINFKEVKRIDHILASLQRKVIFVCTSFSYSPIYKFYYVVQNITIKDLNRIHTQHV